ncbi:MAG: glycoside hydrolase family 78 protein [Eubacterium sp.]|nr:glycoside hydrolase family 78 protein [Eubacterium sp.]
MQIYDMKVNHLTNPLGFRMPRTVFSWKVKEAAGKKQESARLVVAADEGLKEVLFDSGFDAAADSLAWQIRLELKPRTRYYWTVTVRSDAGEESTGEVQWFETAKMQEAWEGKWITCDSGEKRHPYFEKEIAVTKPVKRARLYISGLGLYEAYYRIPEGDSCREERIGEEYLTPYSNDYNEWVQYQTYDVTKLVQASGKLSVLLGNGWYKARFGFSAFEDVGFYGNEWKLIAELRIEYEDGSEEVIGTDESWLVRRSGITFSNLYDGEWRDDTLPDLEICAAAACEPPKGVLTERMSLPVTVHETFDPVELIHTLAGELVFDMGQEFTGLFALRVHEPAGTKIHIQTGEILQGGNFYNENLRTAKSEYFYISDGSEQTITPHFTFYGYRYVKIEGIPELKKEDCKGLALYSNFGETGFMKTGNDLLNRFIENVRWGLKSNFVDVPTDCPQRDERMGWTGDAQVFSPTAMYLTDSYAFYAKYLYDMAQEQKALGGMVPNVIPSCGVEETACVWGDASCIIPWNMYLFYGDKSILADQFESMRSWVDYITGVDGDNHGWRDVFHFGDWLALDHPEAGSEQTFGGTDEAFIANLYYAVSAGLVAKAAHVLGYHAEEKQYEKLSEEQFAVVKNEFYSGTGRCCIKTQTALLLTLKYHLSENEELVKKQLMHLFRYSHGKLRTGFVGTPLMSNILSDHGMDSLAYDLLLNEEYPGWLYEVKLGATTVWERWNSLLADGTISGTSMNSMNHYSYGSVLEWMFRHAAGMDRADGAAGFRQVKFAPVLNWRLRSMEASYDSASGVYACSWELADREHVTLSVTVPFGGSALLYLPEASQEIYEDSRNPMFADVRDGVCYLQPGSYTVSYRLAQPLRKIYDLNTPMWQLKAEPEVVEALKELIDLTGIAEEYMGRSVRVYDGMFRNIGEERLEKIAAVLARCE